MDILFEIEINEFEGGLHQVMQANQLPAIQSFRANLYYIWSNIFQLNPMQIYLTQAEIVSLFTCTKCFLPIKQKNLNIRYIFFLQLHTQNIKMIFSIDYKKFKYL